MQHTLSITAQNHPGVLQRLTGLLRRKCFNIASLTAGKTNIEGISRLTIVISGDLVNAQKAALQINKFIEVLTVKILPAEKALMREIVLVKFRVKPQAQKEFLEYFEQTTQNLEPSILYKVVSQQDEKIILELVDSSQNLADFLKKIKQEALIFAEDPNKKFEILTWVQSGIIAIEK